MAHLEPGVLGQPYAIGVLPEALPHQAQRALRVHGGAGVLQYRRVIQVRVKRLIPAQSTRTLVSRVSLK